MSERYDPYVIAKELKTLSLAHCNQEVKDTLYTAAVLLCNQQDKIKEQQADRRLVNESINNEELWWWQGDGEDYLQSLCNSVNVIISAKKLREIIQPHLITSEINNVYPGESLFDSYDREDAFDEAMKIV